MGRRSLLACLLVLCGTSVLCATLKEDIGYDALATELGASMPDGTGVQVIQVEALQSSNYLPDSADAEFTGKTITDISMAGGSTSSHANFVGHYFYGNTTSLAPGITDISVYEANDFMNGANGLYYPDVFNEPGSFTGEVMNHSWIGTTSSDSADEEILKRLDFVTYRDQLLTVVGVNNGESQGIPNLLGGARNVLAVGRSDGLHSYGTPTTYTSTRSRPDLVVPLNATSYAAAVVSSSLAVLREGAETLYAAQPGKLANIRRPYVMRSVLLAGATKEEFPNWERVEPAPLDTRYGVGELHLQKAWHILAAGEEETVLQTHSDRTDYAIPDQGWFVNGAMDTDSDYCFISVAAGEVISRLSVVLTFDTPYSWLNGVGLQDVVDPPNFSLHLYRADAANSDQLTSELELSQSGGNLEHFYREGFLPPGHYAIAVKNAGDPMSKSYALAWRCTRATSPSDYASWRDLAFANYQLSPSDLEAGADPNADGITNLQAYAFDLPAMAKADPYQPAFNFHESGGENFLELQFRRRRSTTDLTYQLDWCTNFTDWDHTGTDVQEISATTESSDSNFEQVLLRLNRSLSNVGGKVFGRIHLEVP